MRSKPLVSTSISSPLVACFQCSTAKLWLYYLPQWIWGGTPFLCPLYLILSFTSCHESVACQHFNISPRLPATDSWQLVKKNLDIMDKGRRYHLRFIGGDNKDRAWQCYIENRQQVETCISWRRLHWWSLLQHLHSLDWIPMDSRSQNPLSWLSRDSCSW